MSITGSAKFYLGSIASLLAISSAIGIAPLSAAQANDVSADTTDTAVPPTAAQIGEAVNKLRGAMNLPPATVNSQLCAAAGKHSEYLTINGNVDLHVESARSRGYTAANFDERAAALGYAGCGYEEVTYNLGIPDAIQSMFDSPYHRIGFLQPGNIDLGSGVSGSKNIYVTLMLGASGKAGVVTCPADGQKDVPVTWKNVEWPNPLREELHPGAVHHVTGFPITISRFTRDEARLHVTSATLTTMDGKNVPVYSNTPDNDDNLDNSAFLIPQQRLEPGTTYRVTIQAVDSHHTNCSRTWTFTTAGASTAPKYVASLPTHPSVPDKKP